MATVAEATAVIEAIAAETATDTAAAATAQGKSLNIFRSLVMPRAASRAPTHYQANAGGRSISRLLPFQLVTALLTRLANAQRWI